MSAPDLLDDAALLRMEQAAQWLQQLHSDGCDERTLESWMEWCQLDARNQQAFDELASVWELSGSLTLAQKPKQRRIPALGRRQALAATVAGLAVLAGAGAWWVQRPDAAAEQRFRFASPVGGHRVETLPDGSIIELGGNTSVAVRYAGSARDVELQGGELYVTVQPDASRPFAVRSGTLTTVATGTAFNVQRAPDRTVVTVAEGSVEAGYGPRGSNASTSAVRLQQGQQLVYSESSRSLAVRWTDPAAAMAWREGTLRFVNEPLSQVIVNLNRYSSHQIVIENAQIAALTFTGTARTDRIDNWLQALPAVFPVTIVELPDGRRLIRARRDPRTG